MNEQAQEDIEQIDDKKEAKKLFSQVFKFVKKHKLILSIVILVIIILVALFNYIPVLSVNGTKLVNLGVTAKIESGQTIKLKYSDVSAEIKHFSNDVCPAGKTCYGSGPTVEYQLIVDGKKYATGTQTSALGSKYQVETVSSDYKTYAEVKIVVSE